MVRNINNIFHRINLSEQEIRILLGIFSTLSDLNRKSLIDKDYQQSIRLIEDLKLITGEDPKVPLTHEITHLGNMENQKKENLLITALN